MDSNKAQAAMVKLQENQAKDAADSKKRCACDCVAHNDTATAAATAAAHLGRS